jgi:hypothetical protein
MPCISHEMFFEFFGDFGVLTFVRIYFIIFFSPVSALSGPLPSPVPGHRTAVSAARHSAPVSALWRRRGGPAARLASARPPRVRRGVPERDASRVGWFRGVLSSCLALVLFRTGPGDPHPRHVVSRGVAWAP